MKELALDFFRFGLKQAWACVFAGSFFILLFLSRYIDLGPLARYDFLFLSALALQIFFIFMKIETWEEVRIVLWFHLVGLGLEIFKTSSWVGSWSYPEAGFFKIANVPLYSGFMYAAVGSYMIRSWKLLDLKFKPFPPSWMGITLCALIYANFFTNHWILDLRWVLLAGVILIYGRTWVHFTPGTTPYRMPLVLAFFLIGLFIWIAENMATFLGAWEYPDQSARWNLVSFSKISSWGLLVIISFLIIALWKQKKKSQ